MTDHAKLIARLRALAEWHAKEAVYASTELNFDDEPDGGPAAGFHRQAETDLRALAADRAAEPPIPYAAVGETLDETLTRNFPARAAEAAPPEGLETLALETFAKLHDRLWFDIDEDTYGPTVEGRRQCEEGKAIILAALRRARGEPADPPQIPTRLRAAQESEPR